MTGRFSHTRGQCGIIVCRGFEDKQHFLNRCREAASANRGYVIPIDDADLALLVESEKVGNPTSKFALLTERFRAIVT